jgi:hypothetical protein
VSTTYWSEAATCPGIRAPVDLTVALEDTTTMRLIGATTPVAATVISYAARITTADATSDKKLEWSGADMRRTTLASKRASLGYSHPSSHTRRRQHDVEPHACPALSRQITTVRRAGPRRLTCELPDQ